MAIRPADPPDSAENPDAGFVLGANWLGGFGASRFLAMVWYFSNTTGAGSVGVCSEREDGPVDPNCGGAELSVRYRPKATTLGKIGGWRAGRVIRKRASVQHWLNGEKTFDSQAAIITPTPRVVESAGDVVTHLLADKSSKNRVWVTINGGPTRLRFRGIKLRGLKGWAERLDLRPVASAEASVMAKPHGAFRNCDLRLGARRHHRHRS